MSARSCRASYRAWPRARPADKWRVRAKQRASPCEDLAGLLDHGGVDVLARALEHIQHSSHHGVLDLRPSARTWIVWGEVIDILVQMIAKTRVYALSLSERCLYLVMAADVDCAVCVGSEPDPVLVAC